MSECVASSAINDHLRKSFAGKEKAKRLALKPPEDYSDSPPEESILFTLVIRNDTLLADVGVHPSEEVRSTAKDLLNRKPTSGWDTLNIRRSNLKGLRFSVYEMQNGDSPLIWSFACVYDSSQISKMKAQLFLQKIVMISEFQRFSEESWREGQYRACREEFSPILLQQMRQIGPEDDDDLETSERIIKANRKIIAEFERRNSKKQAEEKGAMDRSSRGRSSRLLSFKNTSRHGACEQRDAKNTTSSPVKEESMLMESSDTTESMTDESQSSFDLVPIVPIASRVATDLEIYPESSDTEITEKDDSYRGILDDPLYVDDEEEEEEEEEVVKDDTSVNSRSESSNFDEAAAQLIKSQWRGIVDRRAHVAKREASIKIQKAVRAHLARNLKAQMVCSAILVQSMVRSRFTWKNIMIKKLWTTGASFEVISQARRQQVSRAGIQRFWRGFATRRRIAAFFNSVLLIQSVTRGHACRKQMMVQSKEATCIQKYYRGHRERLRYDFRLKVALIKVLIKAVELIQRQWRGAIHRRDYAAKREASVKIQTAVRSYTAGSQYIKKIRSIVLIQSIARCHLVWSDTRMI